MLLNDKNSLEEMRNLNRSRLLQHIGKIVYNRNLTTKEVEKTRLMLEIGLKIPEILAALHRLKQTKKNTCIFGSVYINDKSNGQNINIEQSNEGSPLEKYFTEYINR